MSADPEYQFLYQRVKELKQDVALEQARNEKLIEALNIFAQAIQAANEVLKDAPKEQE